MKKLLEAKDLSTAIPEYKTLAESLQNNTWKYVYEVRDWLRKDVITAEVGADRSARLNEQHEGIELQLRAKILKLEGTVKELQYSIKTAEKRARADFALGVVCSECKTAGLQDYKAYCLTCLDCAIDDSLDLGHWPVEIESESDKTEAAATTATEQATITATAIEIADDLKEAEYRKDKEDDTRLEDIQQLVSLSLQKLKKAEEADRIAKDKAKLAFASIQVSPEPEEAQKKKKKKKKKTKDLQELAKQQLQSPSKN